MLALLAIPAFAGLDRLKGSGPLWAWWVALVALAGASAAALGWPVGALVGAWGIYRQLPMFGGSLAPLASQRWAAFARHCPPGALAVASAAFGVIGWPVALSFVAYSVLAAMLAVENGILRDKAVAAGKGEKPLVNDIIEITRGALFGACVYAYCFLG